MGTSDNEKEIFRYLLRTFQDIVHKNNITYFLYGGSLIGYYRNRTILAWDDDVDLAMDCNGYHKFLASLDTLKDFGIWKLEGTNCRDRYLFKIFSKTMYSVADPDGNGNYSKTAYTITTY